MIPRSRQPKQMEAIPNLTTMKLIHQLLFFLFYIFEANALAFPNEAIPTKAGMLPVNVTSNSSMFYVFYEAQSPINSNLSITPLVIWLQGGLGCSSMISNFYELGPWIIDSDYDIEHRNSIIKPNPHSWNKKFGLVFVDNPIGTGFSVAATPEEIPRDQGTVASHLFVALDAFMGLNPSFRSRPIYIMGESDAGKFVPALGHYILQKNPHLPSSSKLNLGGIAIGSGWTDPVIQVATLAPTAYYTGLINEKQSFEIEELQAKIVNLTQEGKWREANQVRKDVLYQLQNMTDLASKFDLSRITHPQNTTIIKFLEKEEVMAVLGTNFVISNACNDEVSDALQEDMMKSARLMVDELVTKSKVLLYHGQFDLKTGAISNKAWVHQLKWDRLHKFLMVDRKIWDVNGDIAGYVQRLEGLTHVVVSGAGNLVHVDKPLNTQIMIENWVLDKDLFGPEEWASSATFHRFSVNLDYLLYMIITQIMFLMTMNQIIGVAF